MKKITAALCWLLLGCGCSDPPVVPNPTDTTPPSIVIVYPTSPNQFDSDGDGLAEFVVLVRDSGGIDPAGYGFRSTHFDRSGSLVRSKDLISGMVVDTLGGDTLLIRESIHSPLFAGVNNIEIAARDLAGNPAVAISSVELPYGAHHRLLQTGLPGSTGEDLEFCEDEDVVYMTAGTSLVRIDATELEILSIIPPPVPEIDHALSNGMLQAWCDPSDPRLFLTDWAIFAWDRVAERWVSNQEGTLNTRGLTGSRQDPDILYVGATGHVHLFSRSRYETVQTLSENTGEMIDIVALDGDAKLFVGRLGYGGIAVLAPGADSLLGVISVGDGNLGIPQSLWLSEDSRHLYVAARENGLLDIDPTTHDIVRSLSLPHSRAIDVEGDLAGELAFVSTQGGETSANYLIDLETWEILESFPRPRPAGALRWDRDVLFHPSGAYVLVVHNMDIDIYIVRRR